MSISTIVPAKCRRLLQPSSQTLYDFGKNGRSWESVRNWETKAEESGTSNYMTIVPSLNMEHMLFYQPESKGVNEEGKDVYEIEKFHTTSGASKCYQSPSDIIVKSIKPLRRIKLKKKKKRVSIAARIEDVLNRGKNIKISHSEESLCESLEINEDDKPKKEISHLPEEVIQRIFFHFTQKERCTVLSKVCRSWYFVSKNPVFWTHLEFEGSTVPASTIMNLISSSTMLRSLRLTSVPEAATILQEVCRSASNIKELSLRYCKLGNREGVRTLLLLVSRCTGIEVLDLKGTQFQSKRFYLDLGLLKNLKSLNLGANNHIQAQDLMTISVNCRGLKELKLLHRPTVKNLRKKLRDDNTAFIIGNLQQSLTTLKLDMYQLGTPAYQAILSCENLVCLVMTNCLQLKGETFRKFGQLRLLEKLTITRANDIISEDFQTLFDGKNLRAVSKLDINGCWRIGGEGLCAITKSLPLEFLSLKNCKLIVGSDLMYLSGCVRLKTLNLAHTSVEPNELIMLTTYTKNLEALTIDSDMNDPAYVQALLETCPKLKILVSASEFLKDERTLSEMDIEQ